MESELNYSQLHGKAHGECINSGLDYWNGGLEIFVLIFIILSCLTYPIVFPPNFLHSYTYTIAVHSYWLVS